MNVIAIGPLPVGSLVWQGSAGRILTIVCKATFTLCPGESPLAPVQQPINAVDAHLEDDPDRSVQAPGDLVPYKARADVVLVGFAFAPRAEPVKSLVVRLAVGEIDKAFEVVGDRSWTADGGLGEGSRFVRLSLRYERAGGGPETANPIGVSPEAQSAGPLPNLQPVGFLPSRRGEVIAPVGFGPLSAAWPGRREGLGRLAEPPERWDLAPLPADLDPAYFNCAPRDQQVERLREDERLVLENLHPQHPLLVTSLPRVLPRAFADRGEGLQEIPLAADTLWIDTGAGICTLTWRGYMESPPANGTVVVAMDGPGTPLPWAEVQSAARAGSVPFRSAHAALPFVAASAPAALSSGLPFASQESAPSSVRSGLPFAPQESAHVAVNSGLPFASQESAHVAVSSGLPFAPQDSAPSSRSHSPSSAEAAPLPGDASPSWLQGRPPPVAPPPVVPPPVVPPPSVSWPFTPDASVVAPVQRSAAPASSSPWALGPSISAVAVAAPLPVMAARAAGGAALPNSVVAASDAAADVQSRPLPPPSRPMAPMSSASEKTSRSSAGEVLELLWYDETQVPRMRAWWEELVTDLDFEPSDPRRDLGAEDPDKARGRHNVFGIMSDGVVASPSGVSRVIAEAVNAKGRFTPPLMLIGGELRFPFDEVETLRATILAMTPLVGTDKRLKESIDSMSELLKTPYLQGSTGVVEKLTRELRDQFREANRSLPSGYLDGHVERLLLEQRRYAIRKVFGGEFIRALLGTSGPEGSAAAAAAMTLPVYLPKHLDQALPMLIAMKVRIIAEAHLQQDLYDPSPYALRAVALGRSFQLDAARMPGLRDRDSER
jgi:hypothetical protein